MSLFSRIFSGERSSDIQVPAPTPSMPTQQTPKELSIHYERGGVIVVFLTASEGDALAQLTLDLLNPFRPHCRDIIFIDLQFDNPVDSLISNAVTGVWFAYSFFGGGQDINVVAEGKAVNLWAETGIPFVRVFGDSPAYAPDFHLQIHPNLINFYGHPDHLDFYRRWFDSKGLSLRMVPILLDRLAERPSDLSRKIAGKSIVFPKNGNCPEKLQRYWRSSLSPAIAKALESVAAELGSASMIDKTVDIANELLRYFSGIGIDLSQQRRVLFFMTAQLDDYLRRVKSTMIAKALLDSPVVIRGANWDHVDFTGKRARLDTDSDYGNTRQIIDDALAIMDMSPNIDNLHDRVQRAAGRYTAFLTNRQKYFVERFENYKSFTFEFNPDSIRERVDYALSNPEETVEMGLSQAERMKDLTSDERYAEALMNAIDVCALASGRKPEGTQTFVHYPPKRF